MTVDLFERAATGFRDLADAIVAALEAADPTVRFRRDDWRRDGLGGHPPGPSGGASLTGFGTTCIVEGGALLERGGVGFSQVGGHLSADAPVAMPGEGDRFRATGVSLVLHPRNPYVPIVHMNYRRIERGGRGWFGGGADLTPCYLNDDDARHFHGVLRAVCEGHADVACHTDLKRACDDYFHLPHRDERRGVGGIFFDHLDSGDGRDLAFVRAAGAAFLESWLPLASQHRDDPYGERERDWQGMRRGRYVEFNLLWDRGTTFGLKTGGRIESILLSMPPEASWRYDRSPEEGSPEAALVDVLRTPRSW